MAGARSSSSIKGKSRLVAQFEASIRGACNRERPRFIELALHQTWTWYALILSSALEDEERPRAPNLSVSRSRVVVEQARQIIAALRSLFEDVGVVPRPDLVVSILRETSPTKLAFERLSYYLITELKEHISAAFAAEGERISLEEPAPQSRRSARDRSELPRPDAPAWAKENRMTPKKVQIPCRIDPKIKPLIEVEAAKSGVSQSRWLEEAIVERLQRKGHAIELEKAAKAPTRKPGKPRRLQRPSVPRPDKSVDASVNRADKSTTTRMGPSLVKMIDKARGNEDRSAWMNDAIRAFFEEKAKLPNELHSEESLSQAVAIRFDRDFFPEIEKAKTNSGLTYAEWYRRVARWYLER